MSSIFSCAYFSIHVSLINCSILCLFLIFCLLSYYWDLNVIYIFWMQISCIKYIICNYFLQVFDLSFYCLLKNRISYLKKSNLWICYFTDWAFHILPKKSLPNSGLQRFSPYIFFSRFRIIDFIFAYMVHFEFIFVYDLKYGLKFIWLPMHIVLVPFIEKMFHSECSIQMFHTGLPLNLT